MSSILLENGEGVSSEYIKDLRKKYVRQNEAFGPYGNVGSGLYKKKRSGGYSKIKVDPKMFNGYYVKNPKGKGFIKLSSLWTGLKDLANKAKPYLKQGAEALFKKGTEYATSELLKRFLKGSGVSGGARKAKRKSVKRKKAMPMATKEKVSFFRRLSPYLATGAEKLFSKGTELATDALLKRLTGEKKGSSIRGKTMNPKYKEMIKEMQMRGLGSGISGGAKKKRKSKSKKVALPSKKEIMLNFIPKATSPTAPVEKLSIFKRLRKAIGFGASGGAKKRKSVKKKLPKAANEWRQFAMKTWARLKKSRPNILYKDALKIASKEWRKMK